MKKLLYFTFIISFSASAADFNVSTVQDFRQALIDASNNNEHDTINVAPGHYDVSGGTLLYAPGSGGDFGDDDSGLTIQGEDANSTVLDGKGLVTPLTMQVTSGLMEISGLEFKKGKGENGGGLSIKGDSLVKISNSRFIQNTAQGNGGGFSINPGGNTWISKSTFIKNTAQGNGGGYSGGFATLTDNQFLENKAGGSGGGIYCSGQVFDDEFFDEFFESNECIVKGNEIILNQAEGSGGGVFGGTFIQEIGENNVNDHVQNNRFIENKAGGAGGGLFCSGFFESTSCRIIGNEFSMNEAGGDGGGAFLGSDSVSAFKNSFINNRAGTSGGGASLGGRFVGASRNSFQNNRANVSGGGLNATASGLSSGLSVSRNKFIGNRAELDGGGSHIQASDVRNDADFYNNILNSNRAGQKGGGVFLSVSLGFNSFINNTLTENESGAEGGGAYVFNDDERGVWIFNNIIWNNRASAGSNDGNDLFVDVIEFTNVWFFNNNLGQNANFATANSPDLVVTNGALPGYLQGENLKINPLLTEDLHLQFGSPMIDAGDNNGLETTPSEFPFQVRTDFEDDPRIIDGNGDGKAVVDIGADEDYRGDINNDGCVDRTDAKIVLNKARADSEDPEYDINGDGAVNRADARVVVRLFKKPDSASCETVGLD
jgi:predicted outer membrane repeat protein